MHENTIKILDSVLLHQLTHSFQLTLMVKKRSVVENKLKLLYVNHFAVIRVKLESKYGGY